MEPDAFETQVLKPLELTVAGDKVLMWNVWTFDEDGRATRVETFLEYEERKAREAAGLPE